MAETPAAPATTQQLQVQIDPMKIIQSLKRKLIEALSEAAEWEAGAHALQLELAKAREELAGVLSSGTVEPDHEGESE